MRCLAVGQKANTDSAYDINTLLFSFVLIIFVVTISWRLYFQLGDKIIKPARRLKMKKSDGEIHEKTASRAFCSQNG